MTVAGETRVIIEHARLGADPERRVGKNGTPYMQLRFANTPYRKDRQTGQYENGETEWWTAVEYDERQMQTYLNQLHKGDDIRVEGTLQLSTYQDRQGMTRIDRQIGWARISRNLPKARQQDPQQPTGFAGSTRSQQSAPQGTDPWGQQTGEPEF